MTKLRDGYLLSELRNPDKVESEDCWSLTKARNSAFKTKRQEHISYRIAVLILPSSQQ